MIALTHIGTYLPERRISNLGLLNKFEVDESLLETKLVLCADHVKRAMKKLLIYA